MKLKLLSSSAINGMLLALLCVTPLLARADWQLVWSDEFDGPNVDTSKWSFETGNGDGGWGNNEREYYTARTNNAYVAGGVLHIVARQESMGGFPYTSARMKTQGLFSKKYGRFEFRTKLPVGVGCWPANWMMPQDSAYGGWARSGEIDVMENRGTAPTIVEGTIHYGGSWPANVYTGNPYTLSAANNVTNFHNYMVEWSTNYIKWSVDGVVYQTQTNWNSAGNPYPAPFNQPFYLILNLAIGGNFLSNPSDAAINSGTAFPVEMQLEYVRVYDFVPAPPSVPAAPTGLRASPGSGKVFLSWDDVAGATGYVLKRAASSGGSYTTVATVSSNSVTDTGLGNCSTYYYVVSATNSLGASSISVEQSAELSGHYVGVNSGGSAAGQFSADANVTGGTIGAFVPAAIDTTGLVAPAPQAIYQAERYGNFTYTFNGLLNGGTYKVRLHSAETYWTSVGQRRFNVTINGTQVLTNFDIIAAAGAPNRANIQEFNVAPVSGQIVIQYTTVTDNARASGIELILAKPGTPAGLTATPGSSQVSLKWNALPNALYNVYRATAGAGPYVPVFAGLVTTNCTDNGVTNGVTYYYAVSATVIGCEGTNSAFVSATPVCSPPAAPAAGNNGPLSSGMTLNLTASTVPGATYSWTGPNGFASTAQNPSLLNVDTNFSGTYSVTATTGTCTSTPGTTTVIVGPPAAVTAASIEGNIVLTWPGGTLQSATDVSGPWTDVVAATSPRTNSTSASQEFYRLKLQ